MRACVCTCIISIGCVCVGVWNDHVVRWSDVIAACVGLALTTIALLLGYV